MKIFRLTLFVGALVAANPAFSGPTWASGEITSLKASATEPAIRLVGNISPDNCSGGKYGWLYFQGTPQQRQWIYSTALAMSLSGKEVHVYTNGDGEKCRINNIQITRGLN